jgi:hypothetical protein
MPNNKPASPARKLSTKLANKPAPVATVAKPAAPAPAPAPAAPVATETAKPSANVTRTIATVAKRATNFNGLSDRDNAYLAFYASFAKADAGGNVTVRAIAESGRKPAYNGSAKPHDAGVIVRLVKAGLITETAGAFTFTERGKALAAYTSAKPA